MTRRPCRSARYPEGQALTGAMPVDTPGWTATVDATGIVWNGGPLSGDEEVSLDVHRNAAERRRAARVPRLADLRRRRRRALDPVGAGRLAGAGVPRASARSECRTAAARGTDDGVELGSADDHAEADAHAEIDDEAETAADNDQDDDDDAAPVIIAIVAVVVVLAVGGGTLIYLRRRRTAS